MVSYFCSKKTKKTKSNLYVEEDFQIPQGKHSLPPVRPIPHKLILAKKSEKVITLCTNL